MSVTDAVRGVLPVDAVEREWSVTSAAALGVLLLATVLRVRDLAAESIWMDEVYSVTYVTERSPIALVTELPLEDPHPPLYYLLLDAWVAVFGPGKVAVRSLSVVFGVAGVAAVVALGARLYDRETGVLGGALLALSGMHIYFSQDGRMYALYVALAAASLYWYVRVVFDGDRSRRTLGAYVVATVCLGYTHVFGLFVVLSQHCHLAVRALRADRDRARSLVRTWLGLQAAVVALLAPWLTILGMRLFGLPPFDSASPTWIPPVGLGYLGDTIIRYIGFGWLWDTWGVLIAGTLLGFGAYALARDRDPADVDAGGRLDALRPARRATFLLLVFLVPWLVPFVVSQAVEPIYRAKYTAPAMIGLFLLAARGISLLRWTNIGAGRFAIVGVLCLVLLAAPVTVLSTTTQNPQWEAAVDDIEAADTDPHVVVHGGDVPARFHPTVFLAGPNTSTAVVRANESTGLEGRVDAAVGDRDSFWLVFSLWRTDRDQRAQVWRTANETYRPADRHRYHAVFVQRFER